MRAVLMIFIAMTLLSCKKEEVFNPTGLYNVTTQQGQYTKIGVMTINPNSVGYSIYFDSYAGGYGTFPCEIVNGNIDIPAIKVRNTVYEGSGKVDDTGNLNMEFTMLNWGVLYRIKVVGNKAK